MLKTFRDKDIAFQPTPSARRVTLPLFSEIGKAVISTHTLRKEGDYHITAVFPMEDISTHTLRKEGDTFFFFTSISKHFNPHPPQGG